jgi:enoyl-CoA hydratase
MELRTIRTAYEGDVLVCTIDRPDSPLNAVNDVLHEELAELFRHLKQERTARAILLTGEGKAFSAGGDFAWFPSLRSIDRLEDLRRDAKQLIWDLLDIEQPVVCALNGAAVGLGASIALLCDVLVMADSAVIADPHVKVGITAGDGGAAIWPLAVGPMLAKRYLMTGDPVDAATAERLGLVAEVVGSSELPAAGRRWAARLAAGAPLAVRSTKIAVNQQVKRALLDSYDLSTAYEITTFLSQDHAEALTAMQEKRTPRFEGR